MVVLWRWCVQNRFMYIRFCNLIMHFSKQKYNTYYIWSTWANSVPCVYCKKALTKNLWKNIEWKLTLFSTFSLNVFLRAILLSTWAIHATLSSFITVKCTLHDRCLQHGLDFWHLRDHGRPSVLFLWRHNRVPATKDKKSRTSTDMCLSVKFLSKPPRRHQSFSQGYPEILSLFASENIFPEKENSSVQCR